MVRDSSTNRDGLTHCRNGSEDIEGKFEDLEIYKKARQFRTQMYAVTRRLPDFEKYELTSQIRRACASVPANIAEGCGRTGKAELARFLQVAMGSASELEYHLLLAHDLGLLRDGEYKLLENQAVE